MTETETEIEAARGIEGVEEIEGSASGSRLPFDPRQKGPRDLLGDLRSWSHRRRYWILGAVAVIGALNYWISPDASVIPSVPTWGRVALVAGVVAVPFGVYLGRKVGESLAPSRGYLISQLNAKDGDQDLIRISEERYQSLTVLDHAGEQRPRDYLNDVVVNGEGALEVDAYYPTHNVAVSSWQAGKSNHEIREHEYTVDHIKTELDRAAQAGMKAEMEKPQEVAADVRRHSSVLIAAVEGVLNPSDVDLTELAEDREAERMEGSQEDHLAQLESGHDLLGGGADPGAETNGHGDADGLDLSEHLEGVVETARERVGGSDGEGGGDGE